MKRAIYFVLGLLSFALGTIGIWIPGLPTVPLYLLAVFLFERSSTRMENYLKNSKFYQEQVVSRMSSRWTNARLWKLHIFVFVMMLIPFILIKMVWFRIIIGILFFLHIFGMRLYFYLKYKKEDTSISNVNE
jgi:uncharacterized membrane protein YbaN (DUF454 family)